MSSHPFWTLNFDLRTDLPAHVMDVLAAVARDVEPAEDDLLQLHPVVRYYLADWRRMLDEEREPLIGSPVRLFGCRETRPPGATTGLSIEFGMHDDAHANGGYVFEMWLLSLVYRPPVRPGSGRTYIGRWSLDERDNGVGTPYFVQSDGLDLGPTLPFVTFEQLDDSIAEMDAQDWGEEPWGRWRRR